ncbi:MAG: DUF2203 domain-containing protein [Bryobacteraceae bacterium]
MPKLFTLLEAERILPSVETAIREAIALRSEYEEAESDLQAYSQRIMMLGGALVDRERFSMRKTRRETGATRLKESIDKIQSYGCLIKDLDAGLIDFPTLYRGDEVYLCWKLGENGIGFWHGIEEGFRGRKEIDEDFLDNHKGESAH